MSDTINQAHVQQFKANVHMLAQQKGSRLRRSVRDDGDIVGTKVYFERLAAGAAQRVTNRHGDTPLNNLEHSRRAAHMYDYDFAELVDSVDKLKTLYDPTNPYAVAAKNALGRSMDDEIITALGGSAWEGEAGGTEVAFLAAQKVAVDNHSYDAGSGDIGLSIGKLMAAKDIIYGADVDEDIKLYAVVNQKALSHLMSYDSYKAADFDFNDVKALVRGQINQFMGIEFIRSERLATDGSSDRLCYVYTESAIGCGIPQDISVDIGPRRDKRNATQVYAKMGIGATRIEDAQVVQIACGE